jgi:hypothetical protein
VLRKDVLCPIVDRLGIPRMKGASGFHTFRHSAASIINEQTGNLKLAQKFLGHSTIEMTADIYTHTSAEAEREAAVALERAIYGELFPVVPNLNLYSNLKFSKPLRPSLHWNLVHLRGYWDQAMGGIMVGKTQQGAKRAAP